MKAAGSVFRIEDGEGRLLRRIRGARDPQQALALYWRGVGAAMPGVGMSKDLERRIREARADPARAAMQTPELPFEAVQTQPRQTSRRGRPPRARDPVPQTDLFDEAAPEEAVAPESAAPEAEVEPALAPEPFTLDAQTIMLQQVDPRNLRPTDRADSYLYHVTNGPDAKAALRSGLLVSAADPVILTERQGVAYWLSVLAEDYDYILDGPADFVVLRMRRMAVAELLEPDAGASRNAGCPCFLLTGAANPR